MLASDLVEDITVYFDGGGVPAEFAGTFSTVLFDESDEDILHGVGQSTVYMMTFVAADFPDLGHGASVIVNGQSYQVHSVNKLAPDGALKQARLFAVL